MNTRIFLAVSASVFTLALAAAPANAQATRTWVSGVGDDVNPCSRTAPCKTFAGAISKTATNGEINCLDPAGYGTLNITKSITIDCGPYTMGGVLAANVNGFLINGAGIVVTLRGLTINGAGTTTGNGIRILQAGAVNIDNVTIENFGGTGSNGRGVTIETGGTGVRVTIQDSHFYNLNNDAIHSQPTGGNVILTVENSTIARGGDSGISLVRNTLASIDRTSVTNHTIGAGVTAEQASVTVSVSNSVLSNNAFGVFNGLTSGATMRLYGNVITGSTSAGLLISSGSVLSYGNNAIRGNTGNEVPTGAVIGTQ